MGIVRASHDSCNNAAHSRRVRSFSRGAITTYLATSVASRTVSRCTVHGLDHVTPLLGKLIHAGGLTPTKCYPCPWTDLSLMSLAAQSRSPSPACSCNQESCSTLARKRAGTGVAQPATSIGPPRGRGQDLQQQRGSPVAGAVAQAGERVIKHPMAAERDRERCARVFHGNLLARLTELGAARSHLCLPLIDLDFHGPRAFVQFSALKEERIQGDFCIALPGIHLLQSNGQDASRRSLGSGSWRQKRRRAWG